MPKRKMSEQVGQRKATYEWSGMPSTMLGRVLSTTLGRHCNLCLHDAHEVPGKVFKFHPEGLSKNTPVVSKDFPTAVVPSKDALWRLWFQKVVVDLADTIIWVDYSSHQIKNRKFHAEKWGSSGFVLVECPEKHSKLAP